MHQITLIFHICVLLIFGVKAVHLLDDNGPTYLAHINRVQPTKDEIHLNEGDPLELECTDFKNVTFIHPESNYIPLSAVEIEYHYIDNIYKARLKRKRTFYGDTGWYGCVDTDKFLRINKPGITLTPDNFNEIITWVYVYVKSTKQAFHNNVGKYTTIHAEIGDDVLLPCRVNSPDYQITVYHEDEIVDKNNGKFSYNPRKGLLIKNVMLQDSGYYQCLDNIYHHSVNYILYITKKLADMYNPVIEEPKADELVLGEQLKLKCSVEIAYDTTYSFGWTTEQNDRIFINSYNIDNIHNDTNSWIVVKELIIKNATSEDQGEYTCYVSSEKKTKSAKVNIKLSKAAPVYCMSKKDLLELKDSILKEMKSNLEDIIVHAIEKSVSKNIEESLSSIRSKLEQYF